VLVEVRAMLAGAVGLLDDLTKPADSDSLMTLIYNIQKITLAAETEMNKAILSCKRARGQTLENVSLTKPTLH